uniref:Calnexin n=1 Tax=Pyramimonas obovata TaxID=1411642 RepID=A0A7S0RXX3_9CHLO|eukprot:CAMPEP_0118922924 /NCGR_PEP_ID=MMETSP1169-20130426/1661_1 /TAXON_ID=36882 /ORGANISM="Pyramimonas obovata, Strain CCMP722" /LENGTH=535 /DNA_ID=CAMNT_0006863853 /DNA_START=60 /DNA_END=1667 /DNA_ORIENTATION=-
MLVTKVGAAIGVLLFATCALAAYDPAPTPSGEVIFLENFEGESAWVNSAAEKYTGKLISSKDPNGDTGKRVGNAAQHYGSGVKIAEPIDPSKGFTFQYEVTLNQGLECGGAYVKLLTETPDLDLKELDGDTPYTIMFGPDKCGGTNKVHMILRHKSPKTGEIEEKHLSMPPTVKIDQLPHLYTLTIKPDNTYEILIDNEVSKEGSLLEDFEPPINPPKEIDDPTDSKPEDWVDEAEIPDPEDSKPEDWDEEAPRMVPDEEAEMPEGWLVDEPDMIADPEAEMPDDWDEEEDGVFEAPLIENPACAAAPGCGEWERPEKLNPDYKGKWYPKMIPNPDYVGEWAPKQISNPDYFLDETPLASIGKIGAAAVEIWTMNSGILFDNFLATYDEMVADDYAEKTWRAKHDLAVEREAAEAQAKAESGGMMAMVERLSKHWIFKPIRPYIEPIVDGGFKNVDPTAMLVVLIGIPVLLLVALYTCCSGKPRAADPKKTDEPQADDKPEEKAEEAEAEEEEEEEEEKEVVEEVPVKRRTRRAQ